VGEDILQAEGEARCLRALVQSVPQGIILLDGRRQVLFRNPAAERWLAGALAPDQAAQLLDAIGELAARAAERPSRVLELGEEALELQALPAVGAAGEEGGAVVTICDVSAWRRRERSHARFVSDVAHELRTPVTTIRLYAALMRRMPSAEWEQYLEALDQEAARQAVLVDDLLELARLDAGRIELHRAAVSLGDLARAAALNGQATAREAGVALEVAPCAAPPRVLADPERLLHALDHLVDNALRYTPAGGRVELAVGSCEQHGRAWGTLSLRDTGIGIPEDERPHIFERFFRGQRPRQMGVPGTGLGLAIVEGLIGLHGGYITVESRVGAGSTFTVHLPLVEAGARREGTP